MEKQNNKLQKIDTVAFTEPKYTQYGTALTMLTMGWCAKASPDNALTNGGMAVRLFSMLGATVGSILTFSGIMALIAGKPLMLLIAGPVAVLSFGALHLCARKTTKRNKKLLEDPAVKFAWRIARTAKSFNERVIGWNGLVAAAKLGRAELPEDADNIYNELVLAREELTNNIAMLEGMQKQLNPEPELSVNLEKLRDVKTVLRELRQSDEPRQLVSQNQNNIVGALQSESAYSNLRLLPEKTE